MDADEGTHGHGEFPSGTAHLSTQVAGHSCDNKNYSFGLLVKSGRYVLKPVEKEQHGNREIDFYRRVTSTKDPLLLELKALVPEFYGTEILSWNDSRVNYIVLSNVTHGMAQPCVMDIKIGKQTWDPYATEAKRQREQEKYAVIKQHYSFCIPGFQVYDASTSEFKKYGKDFGKNLTIDGTVEAFKTFFNLSHESGRATLLHILERLKKIVKWFKSQRHFHFYSSSILIAYDAKELSNFPSATVTMIDFAHVYPANGEEDLNYIAGVEKLVELLDSIAV
ncbi:inositol polyphosphate multikinase [Cloeon dipterum]|uniref:inositol polyphosphate multikinase n=1 Tax=Cloeon dipterum TaxID=197152 RepID=UPI003220270C